MPVQTGGREGAAKPGTEGAMLAQVPLWDRDRQAPRGGRPISDPAMDAGEAGPGPCEPVDAAYETQPAGVGVATGDAPGPGLRAGVIVAAVAAVAAIAAAGWYASRPPGVAELTPGGPEASPVAYVTAAPEDLAAPPAAAGPAPVDRQAAMPAKPPKDAERPAPRVRPAPSATDAAANASATAAPTITPPTPGSPSTDPMTVNPAPGARSAPAESAPSVGTAAPATPPADPGTTP